MSDLRGERPVRVSGAFDIDMSKVTEEAARRAAEQVATALGTLAEHLLQAIMPALAQVKQAVETSTALTFPAGLMNQDDARATLASMLPAGLLTHGTAEQVADFQLQRLTEAGYAVVPVAGTALEHAIKVAQHRQRLAEAEPARHGVQGVDVDRYEATARADARLAQARRDGQDDSWHEND